MPKEKTTVGELLKNSKGKGMTTDQVDQATRKIKRQGTEEPKEKTKRLSIDTPHSLYIQLKKTVAERDISVREFVIEQIRKGINE